MSPSKQTITLPCVFDVKLNFLKAARTAANTSWEIFLWIWDPGLLLMELEFWWIAYFSIFKLSFKSFKALPRCIHHCQHSIQSFLIFSFLDEKIYKFSQFKLFDQTLQTKCEVGMLSENLGSPSTHLSYK